MALVFGGLLAAGNALSIDGLSADATLFLTGFVLLLAAIGERIAPLWGDHVGAAARWR